MSRSLKIIIGFAGNNGLINPTVEGKHIWERFDSESRQPCQAVVEYLRSEEYLKPERESSVLDKPYTN